MAILISIINEHTQRDIYDEFREIYALCREYTMTSEQRMMAVYSSIAHICSTPNMNGDIVECGVWKGGSMMMAAMALMKYGNTSRKLYLYDTFEGMTEPGPMDYDRHKTKAEKLFKKGSLKEPLPGVIKNMSLTGYPAENIIYVKGRVEDTIPSTMPERIALLRLDTDWYESTRHELEHLYPRLIEGGVLIVDDYGHWCGARKAVDEYMPGKEWFKIDYTGRMLLK